MKLNVIAGLFAAFCLSSCGSLGGPIDPPSNEISLTTALKDVGKGFSQLREQLAGQPLGLFPCKLTMTLSVRASAITNEKLVVGDISELGFETRRNDDWGQTNNIVVELYNPACLPEKTVGFSKPTSVQELKMGMIIRETELKDAVVSPLGKKTEQGK